MLANIRATWAASDDGTPPGLQSNCTDISFMISDILRGCCVMVSPSSFPSDARLPHLPPVWQPLPHRLRRRGRIELFRVEPPADPLQHFLVLLVLLVADGIEKF